MIPGWIRSIGGDKGPKTPKNIAKARDINLTDVGHHLIKLKEHEFVTVINPNAPRHRYYRLTVNGRKFAKRLEEIGFFND